MVRNLSLTPLRMSELNNAQVVTFVAVLFWQFVAHRKSYLLLAVQCLAPGDQEIGLDTENEKWNITLLFCHETLASFGTFIRLLMSRTWKFPY